MQRVEPTDVGAFVDWDRLASSWLSSNNRTIAAFLAVLAGWPTAFFWYELTVLNVALVVVLVERARRNAKVVRSAL